MSGVPLVLGAMSAVAGLAVLRARAGSANAGPRLASVPLPEGASYSPLLDRISIENPRDPGFVAHVSASRASITAHIVKKGKRAGESVGEFSALHGDISKAPYETRAAVRKLAGRAGILPAEDPAARYRNNLAADVTGVSAFVLDTADVDQGHAQRGWGTLIYRVLVHVAAAHGAVLVSHACAFGSTSNAAEGTWRKLGDGNSILVEEAEIDDHADTYYDGPCFVAWAPSTGSRSLDNGVFYHATATRNIAAAKKLGSPNHRLPSHLRFLDRLAETPHDGLAAYFPATARGTLRPRRGEQVFHADGIGYVGPTDGTMVPVEAENLEPMEQNEWDGAKFAALVDAIRSGDNPVVDPGYADLWLDGGALTAQVRDGNHRTFAPVAAGGSHSWVWLSDRMRQDLEDRSLPGMDALYRAIRAAQRAAGAPLYTRRAATRLKHGAVDVLAKAQARAQGLDDEADAYYRKMLAKYGYAVGTGFGHAEQAQRPQIFWRMRMQELKAEHGADWLLDTVHLSPQSKAHDAVMKQRMDLSGTLLDLRKAAGLKHGERLDPRTRKVVAR